MRATSTFRQYFVLCFVLALTAAAWVQTKASDNPCAPTQATPPTGKVELLRDRPLFDQYVQSAAANEQNNPVRLVAFFGRCPSGQTSCSGVCTTLSTDSRNCGSCGNACGAGTSCVNGACVQNLLTNGSACQSGSQCSSGSCAQGVCCNTSCNSCSGTSMQACNLTGHVGTCSPMSCGNFACSNNACFTTCSNDTNCAATSFCNITNSVCMPKYGTGMQCTGNNQCMSGSCAGNVCQ
jgi:stigma-specific protein Stig1/Dickkopf-like protein